MNYYEELEVSRNASQEVIRAAYKNLVQRYHPDKNNGETHERLVRITEAYRVLSDPEARKKYDELFSRQNREASKTTQKEEPKKVIQEPSKAEAGNKKYDYLFFLLAACAIPFIFYLVQKENKRTEDQYIAQAKARSEKEATEKKRREESIKNRTKVLTLPYTIKLSTNQSCEINFKQISIPPVKVILGEVNGKKALEIYPQATALIQARVTRNIENLTACDFLKINSEKIIEKIVVYHINETIYGIKHAMSECGFMREGWDGTLIHAGTAGDEGVRYACEGVEIAELQGKPRIQ